MFKAYARTGGKIANLIAAKYFTWLVVCVLLISASPAPAQEAAEPAVDTAETTEAPSTPPAGEAPEAAAPSDEAPAEEGEEGQEDKDDTRQLCTWQTMIPLLVIVAVFYFLIIMPQKKREKERKKMLSDIKKNDRVMTIGGIHGIVYSVTEDEVVLKVDERGDVRMHFARSAISRVFGREGEEAGPSETQLPPQAQQ